MVDGYLSPPTERDRSSGLGQLGPRVAQALRQGDGAVVDRAPPVSLTPTDGSELAIRALNADIQIRGPLAHTELHFVFYNAEPRVREGRFTIAMPPGAAVSRFAMKIGDDARRGARRSDLRVRAVQRRAPGGARSDDRRSPGQGRRAARRCGPGAARGRIGRAGKPSRLPR